MPRERFRYDPSDELTRQAGLPGEGALPPAMRAEVERLKAECQEQQKTYCVVYATVRMALDTGDGPGEVRAMMMAEAREGAKESPDPYDQEHHVELIRVAVEDALALRPPRYPRWFSERDALARSWVEGGGTDHAA